MSRVRIVDLTLSLDTGAYASGDVLANTQVVTDALRDKNVGGTLRSLTVIDEDDQKAVFDIYFLDAASSLGAENGPPDITDAAARSLLGKVAVAVADYKDLGGVAIAHYDNLNILLRAATDSKDIYVGVINGSGSPTYTASGLKLRLGIED